jgi:hypothetical protein
MQASTKNAILFDKGNGIRSTVNGVVAMQTMGAGALVDVIGFDGAGTPIHETKQAFVNSLTIAPSQITAGTLPTNVVVGGAQLSGVINPAVMQASTTHVNIWSKTGGLRQTVNGVVSDTTIAGATIVDVLGYDTTGVPVWQTKTAFSSSLTISPSQLTPGVLPAGVTMPAAQVTGQSNTLVYAPATGLLTSTVNGFPATATITVPTLVPTRVSASGATYIVPNQTVVGQTTTYVALVIVGAAGTNITLPAIASYPLLTPLRIKTVGGWTGSVVVTPASGLIDAFASFTINKTAALRPSITVVHDGTNWYVV